MAAFTGQLYQLHSTHRLHTGAYVAVNGPWDKFGVVLSSKPDADGSHLNLIRGVKERKLERPIAEF